jgi:hypothetical protein
MTNGIHIVVFCAVDYTHLLEEHLESVYKFVQDSILSVTVVSNTKIFVPTGCNLVLDKQLWDLIDRNFLYLNLYKHNWIKQQILKLSLNMIIDGNILLSDVEVRYHKPITWMKDNQNLIFYKKKPFKGSEKFVKDVINITPSKGYLTESMIFSTDILDSLRQFIENRTSKNILDSYRDIIFDNPKSTTPELTVFMSEYELYNNYLIEYFSDRVWKLLPYDRQKFSSIRPEVKTINKDAKTQWLNFYDQVKDESWPDCSSEEEFYNLPKEIQDECINIHGYVLRKNK